MKQKFSPLSWLRRKDMILRLFLPVLLFSGLALATLAQAMTPTLSLINNNNNNNGDTVQINVSGDANASVLLYYSKTNAGQQIYSLGTTNTNGSLSTTVSTSALGVASGSSVYVRTGGIGGTQSNTVAWPVLSSSNTFSLSQTAVTLAQGQSTTITATNSTANPMYLSNNSNPPVANVNISGNTATILGNSYGSTTVTLCAQGTNGTANCASAYVTVQNGASSALTFSISNVTVSPGQSVPISISGGTGTYTVLSNSNSGVIQTNLSGSTITISTTATTGSSAITVCSSNMSSCGIINATASTASTTPISFSQTSPALSVGQNINVVVSGSSNNTYYVSNNSNSTAVTASISGNNLSLTGSSVGTATITVCGNGGSCGSLTASVAYTSSGGTFQLSQTSVSVLVGQVVTVTASGGMTPYSLASITSSAFQASLAGNVITISGINAGNGTLQVCTTGSACLPLTIYVNASGANGTPPTFSQNNLNLSAGAIQTITITGAGGYYVSNSSNPAVASAQISGSTAIVTASTAGTTNISICQSGGQCAILFVTVGSGGTATASVPQFSQTSPSLSIGQSLIDIISGGTSSSYYISANTNPGVAQLTINNNQLTITGVTTGTDTAVICASSTSCGSLLINVGATASPIIFTTTALPAATVGQSYSAQLAASDTAGGTLAYSVMSGSLPTGLTLSSNGIISGVPAGPGTSNITFEATDNGGHTATANITLTVNTPTSNLEMQSPTTATTTTPATTTPPAATSGGTYASGQLINENGTIYIVYLNTKVGFANAPAFLGLGFKFDNVQNVSNSGLAVSPKVVVTADGAHPRGAWISSGKTVYFVMPAGNIPVPTWSIFTGNGGQASFIVPANSYDLARATLPLMTANDSRLQP